MTDEQLLMAVHSYPDNIDVLCHRKIRMGKIGDGGWEICDDPGVRPTQPCIIYSFGINDDFSFDDDAAKVYGCHVYSFDPSMKGLDHYNRSNHVHFYKIGLDGKTYTNSRNWTLMTLSDIRKKLRHENTPVDLIKMDIEHSEWPSIMEMTSSRALDGVRQFLVEYHMKGFSRENLLPRMKAMKAIEAAGFRRFYSHKNVFTKSTVPGFPVQRTTCYELHYLRQ
ncbi:probable methyltransferase-like protein 24 [Physella acuta]|uniref:probable methyltransferase-like protein 24 n=1 Tax=Physella acuta TaxID=109671 RepID=UPI0027DE2AF4|nr:probable methyltransferase-like protein 24 [Physella acuta]